MPRVCDVMNRTIVDLPGVEECASVCVTVQLEIPYCFRLRLRQFTLLETLSSFIPTME